MRQLFGNRSCHNEGDFGRECTYQAEFGRVDEVRRAEAHEPREKVADRSGTADRPRSQPGAHDLGRDGIAGRADTAVVEELEQRDERGQQVRAHRKVVAGAGCNRGCQLADSTRCRPDDQDRAATHQVPDAIHPDVDADEPDARRHDRVFEGFGHTALLEEVGLVRDQEPNA